MMTETQISGLHVTGTPKKAAIKVAEHAWKDKDDYVCELTVTVGSKAQRILLKGGDLYDLTKGLMDVMQMNMMQEEKE